jgi:hypothetical protein
MISEAKNNVIKFHEYVNNQMNTLDSRGQTSNDIIINLFTGCMAYTDKTFEEYMEKCKDNYEDGEDVNYQGIMLKEERKYQARVMNNEWNTLTSEQEQITVFKAQIASINSFKPKK